MWHNRRVANYAALQLKESADASAKKRATSFAPRACAPAFVMFAVRIQNDSFGEVLSFTSCLPLGMNIFSKPFSQAGPRSVALDSRLESSYAVLLMQRFRQFRHNESRLLNRICTAPKAKLAQFAASHPRALTTATSSATKALACPASHARSAVLDRRQLKPVPVPARSR